MEADQGDRPLDHELAERAQHPPPCVLAVVGVDDELRDQRVVDTGDLASLGHARVDAHAGPGGLAVGGHEPRGRQEAPGGVFRVDPALDRVAAELDLGLGERERLAQGDADLLADEVEPGRHW